MKNLILFGLSFLFCYPIFAQNTITVNVHISDYDGQPVQGKFISLEVDSTEFFSYGDYQYSDNQGNVTFEFTSPAEAPTGEMTTYTTQSCSPENGTHTLQWTEENSTFEVSYELCLPPCTSTLDFDESTGALTVNFVNGEAPYSYNWNTGQTSPTIYPNSSGSYCVNISDAGQCSIYQCFYYNANPEGDSLCTIFIDTLINTNLEVELTAQVTGVAPFSYQWNTGETTATIIGEGQQTYCVTVTDATGCNRFECRNIGYVPECYVELNYDAENNQFSTLTLPLDQTFNFIWSTGEINQTGTLSPQESGYYSLETEPNCYNFNNAQYYIGYAPQGQIWITDSTETANHGATVYTIQYDEEAGTLTEITTTDAWSIYDGSTAMEYEFADQSAGTYLLKAALKAESPYYDTHLPTYYPGVLYWNEAEEISLPQHSPSTIPTIDWVLQAGENLGGLGFIGGLVSDGANLHQKNGEPMEGVTVILEDAEGNPITFDYTNADGRYKFVNLPLGTYRIAIDILNYPVGEKWVTLSESEMNLDGNDFEVTENEISTSIFKQPARPNYIVSITPNPTKHSIFVNLDEISNGLRAYEIIDITGRKILSSTANSFRINSKINVSGLQKGIYFLKLHYEDNQVSVGKFIKN